MENGRHFGFLSGCAAQGRSSHLKESGSSPDFARVFDDGEHLLASAVALHFFIISFFPFVSW